jgi:CRISPR-associated protein Cmr4
MSKKVVLFMIVETSIHTGSGEDVGYVDQPIQRDKVTGFPIIQPSEVKGALRDYLEENYPKEEKKIEELFGPEDKEKESFASALSFVEAKTLFFPVKSLYGIFAYITCPLVLNRFAKDTGLSLTSQFGAVGDDIAVLPSSSSIIKVNNNQIVLNEYPFKVGVSYVFPKVSLQSGEKDFFEFLKDSIFLNDNSYEYWKNDFLKRIAILSDDNFRIFVETGTEIVTRNKIGEEGTADIKKGGNLWTEENLPQETILYSLLHISKPYKKENPIFDKAESGFEFLKGSIDNKHIQIGGNKTIGKGFVFVKFLE